MRSWLFGAVAAATLSHGCLVGTPVQAQGQAAADDVLHVVGRGQTMIAIAAELLVRPGDWAELQKLNGIRNPRRLVPGSLLRIPTVWLRQTPTRAEIVFVQGECLIQPAGSAATTPAQAGARVGTGDILRAGAASSMTLRFPDGSRTLVVSNTEFVIERLLEYGRAAIPVTRLRLNQGDLDTHVVARPDKATRFEVRTPAVNLGVRGTSFRAHIGPQDGSSRAEVLEGQVLGSGAARAVALNAGFGAVAREGQGLGAPRALLPAPDLGGLPGLVEHLPLRLSWRPLPGAVAYRAQVFAAGSADRLLLDGVFDAPPAKWADLPDGRYEFRVRALDGQGLEGRDAGAAFTLKARPEPPFTSEPAAGAKVYGENAKLVWAASTAASRYRLQVASSADFARPLVDRTDLTAPTATVALPPGRYFWRVAGIAGDADQGPFGDTQSFEQRAMPPSPALEPPQVTEGGVVFRWKAPETGERVQFQVAQDIGFERIVLDRTVDAAQGLLPDPGPGTYYLRVRRLDADGFAGNFGAPQSVDVPHLRWWWLLPLAPLLILL